MSRCARRNDVRVALQQKSHRLFQAVEHHIELVDLQSPVLRAWKSQMVFERRNDEPHEVDVVNGVRLLGRQVRPVAVGAHECEHDEVGLEGEPILCLERGRDAGIDRHPGK